MRKRLKALAAVLLCLTLLAGCGAPVAGSAGTQGAAAGGKLDIDIAGLKGATTMGMVKLMEQAEAGESPDNYRVTMYGTADEITAGLVGGEIEIAAIPANLASVLWNSSSGKIRVAAINTLGTLYVVETGESINSITDLKGKKLYSTGKGTTPEFAFNHILTQNGLDPLADLDIEYKSESTEIAALLGTGADAIAVLPQPYVTAVQMQNERLRVALNLSEEWDKVSADSGLVTGVLVANTAWLQENSEAFAHFQSEYEASIEWVNDNILAAAQLVAQYGVVENAAVAESALPACNIVYIAGTEMQRLLAGYLEVLFGQKPEAVGGKLPDDSFYYGLE